jgi:hypothetical protein
MAIPRSSTTSAPLTGRIARARSAVRLRLMLGAASKRQRTNPPQKAGELAEIVLPDHDGNDVRLAELWAERPAALVWLRHYG